jgi:DNA-3-methyladenine glycosylase II
MTPEAITDAKEEDLRSAGLSAAKVSYVRDLAERTRTGVLDLERVSTLADEEIYKELVAVKGIGPWTAEMFMIFALRRDDIFSPGDLGLINAMIKLYRLRKPVSKKRIEQISRKWSPYRTLASRYLWASLEAGDGTWP